MTDYDRAELVAAFDRDDAALSAAEKETLFRFARDDERVTFYTEQAGIGRRLIAHPKSTIDRLTVRIDNARRQISPSKYDNEVITGVGGSIPIGVLKIQKSGRDSGTHVDVVTDAVLKGAIP